VLISKINTPNDIICAEVVSAGQFLKYVFFTFINNFFFKIIFLIKLNLLKKDESLNEEESEKPQGQKKIKNIKPKWRSESLHATFSFLDTCHSNFANARSPIVTKNPIDIRVLRKAPIPQFIATNITNPEYKQLVRNEDVTNLLKDMQNLHEEED
jgi:hypothetical protein